MKLKLIAASCALAGIGISSLTYAELPPSDEALAMPKANVAQADLDSDGALTRDEFVPFVNADDDYGRSAKVRRFNAYERAFTKIDSDENVKVSWVEFVAAQ